ncbi:Flp pilus assembly complex ATPase component TadA [Erwinia amylovora]|uniref:ATPase, T2SS/T4P/T4SS family n=1 Tax=Erwinia amylovora TaxID=552 RepID=UPI0020BF42E6|nr:ATPase, T2SS/T4P/T4SS family [Erwinia amylovora]MCK8349976.1 Flp pilus assembly complex ATPase component TadA [Erwinia amylovora]
MSQHAEQAKNRQLNTPHGILLETGPTGSGKSTTLYAGINLIHSYDKNIKTIEDQVE